MKWLINLINKLISIICRKKSVYPAVQKWAKKEDIAERIKEFASVSNEFDDTEWEFDEDIITTEDGYVLRREIDLNNTNPKLIMVFEKIINVPCLDWTTSLFGDSFKVYIGNQTVFISNEGTMCLTPSGFVFNLTDVQKQKVKDLCCKLEKLKSEPDTLENVLRYIMEDKKYG